MLLKKSCCLGYNWRPSGKGIECIFCFCWSRFIVTVTEISLKKMALQAAMDGFEVKKLEYVLAEEMDIIVTATGNKEFLQRRTFL